MISPSDLRLEVHDVIQLNVEAPCPVDPNEINGSQTLNHKRRLNFAGLKRANHVI